MGIPKTHEIFSLTNQLTHMTDSWYNNAADQRLLEPENMSFGVQLQGRFFSRIVNLLIIVTELIDVIAHIAMGALTLLILAPGEALYNLGKDKTDRSDRFTVIGGLTNFGYSLKHLLEAIPRAVIGVFHPGMAHYMFQTSAQQVIPTPMDEDEIFLL
ncbi:MAG: hypothetical protein H0T62_01850 [Parachlamydiaceae bacterium]|nr:hypothetical protein [Parachlamydiaceae bacterium]